MSKLSGLHRSATPAVTRVRTRPDSHLLATAVTTPHLGLTTQKPRASQPGSAGATVTAPTYFNGSTNSAEHARVVLTLSEPSPLDERSTLARMSTHELCSPSARPTASTVVDSGAG